MSDRATMERIAALVLDFLQRERGCSGYGIELDEANVLACVKRGVDVIQLNLEEGLAMFDDSSFDVVLQIDTLQHLRNAETMLVETARVHPALAAGLLATVERTAATRRVLVHGDVSPKNILLGPQGPVLLDAECAWFGDPAFDIAFCLNHFLLKTAHLPQHGAVLMDAYRAIHPAYFAHVGWEPPAALETRVATLLPGLTLARVDGKSPAEYLGAPQRDAVRAAAITLLQDAPTTLETLAARWAREFAA